MQPKHKIIQVGNSAAVTIPQPFLKKAGWKVGDEIYVEADPQENMLTLRDSNETTYKSGITPEFKDWLDSFTKKHAKLLKELART